MTTQDLHGAAQPILDETTERVAHPDVDALKALLSFHGRIRLALKTLAELAARSASDGDIHIEAQAMVDFFRGPLAWHDMDEEVSLLPRLRRVEHPEHLDRVLATVTRAHERLETTVEGAIPHLLAVAEGRATPEPDLLKEAAQALRDVLEPHLAMEEQEVFPLARKLLNERDLLEMARELDGRARERKSGAKRVVQLS